MDQVLAALKPGFRVETPIGHAILFAQLNQENPVERMMAQIMDRLDSFARPEPKDGRELNRLAMVDEEVHEAIRTQKRRVSRATLLRILNEVVRQAEFVKQKRGVVSRTQVREMAHTVLADMDAIVASSGEDSLPAGLPDADVEESKEDSLRG